MHFIDESLIDVCDVVNFIKEEIHHQEEKLSMVNRNRLFFLNRSSEVLDEAANESTANILVRQHAIESTIQTLNRLIRKLNEELDDHLIREGKKDDWAVEDVEAVYGLNNVLINQ